MPESKKIVLSTGKLEATFDDIEKLDRRMGILRVDYALYVKGSAVIGEIFHKLKIIPVQVNTNLATNEVFVYFICPYLNVVPLGMRLPNFVLELHRDDNEVITNAKLVEMEDYYGTSN